MNVSQEIFARTMEADVIRRLLSGNDMQCFTTAQFAEAVDQWVAELCGCRRDELGIEPPPIELRRNQLLAVAPVLIVEVGLDVWSSPEFARASVADGQLAGGQS